MDVAGSVFICAHHGCFSFVSCVLLRMIEYSTILTNLDESIYYCTYIIKTGMATVNSRLFYLLKMVKAAGGYLAFCFSLCIILCTLSDIVFLCSYCLFYS